VAAAMVRYGTVYGSCDGTVRYGMVYNFVQLCLLSMDDPRGTAVVGIMDALC
jgi:hypothetical protein